MGTELTLLTLRGVDWVLTGLSPKESLYGVREEPLGRGAVVVAHGGRKEGGCGSTRRSMTKVVDAIRCLVRARSGRSPARTFEYLLDQKMEKIQGTGN